MRFLHLVAPALALSLFATTAGCETSDAARGPALSDAVQGGGRAAPGLRRIEVRAALHQGHEHRRRPSRHAARRARADGRGLRPLVLDAGGDGDQLDPPLHAPLSPLLQAAPLLQRHPSDEAALRLPRHLARRREPDHEPPRHAVGLRRQHRRDHRVRAREQLRLRAKGPRARRVRHGHLTVGDRLDRRPRGLPRRGADDERAPERRTSYRGATSRSRKAPRPPCGGPSASTRSSPTRPPATTCIDRSASRAGRRSIRIHHPTEGTGASEDLEELDSREPRYDRVPGRLLRELPRLSLLPRLDERGPRLHERTRRVGTEQLSRIPEDAPRALLPEAARRR